jgi:hypothetical protein
MYSISAKVLLSLAALLVFLFSCSRESPEPLWEVQSPYGNDYEGGLHPVYITLKNPVDDASHIEWVFRKTAHIAYRKHAINSKKQITADTAFFYWDEPPPLYVKYDSTQIKKDTIVSWKIDTSYYYRDTIFVRVDNDPSLPIVIDVKNILPSIKSITVGGVNKPPKDSLLTIAANLGVTLEISFNLEKPFKNPFNSSFHIDITMPPLMSSAKLIKEKSDSSIFVYEWTMPNVEISDSSGYLKVKDSGIPRERLYKVHLVGYTERGSVWVASKNELVKFSPTGTEVARVGDFGSISDISVNSKDRQLLVVDYNKNSFSIYDCYGKQLYKNDSLFKLPSGIAFGMVSNYVWVADAEDPLSSVYKARLRRFLMSDSLRFASVSYEMSGPITGLSVNQFQKDFVWFAIPENDTVGFTRESGLEPKFIMTDDSVKWNRPSMISHDRSNGIAWVADSSRVVAIDTNGHVWAKISGFDNVSSVSASKGNVWVSDNLLYTPSKAGKVYLFKGPFGFPQDTSLTIYNGRLILDFIDPISISAYIADGGAWVIDREKGMAIRLDSAGTIIASGTGLKQPIFGKTLQSED